MNDFTTDDAGILDADSAFAGADFGDIDAPETQAEEDSAEGEQEPEAPAGDTWKDEGPGDLRVALRQSRDEARAAKEAAQRATAEAQQMRAYLEQQQAQQRAMRDREVMQQQIEQMDPDDIPAYLEAQQRQAAHQMQVDAQQRLAWTTMEQSEAFARQALPDYDAQIQKLVSVMGLPAVQSWALQQQNPAMAAYQAAKGFFTQSEIDAAREEGRKAALDSLAARTQARKPSAPPRVGAVPASSPNREPDPLRGFDKKLAAGSGTQAFGDAVADMFRLSLG